MVLGIIYVHFDNDKGESIVVTAFQIVLLIVILVSFSGAVGEKKDINLRNNMTYICIFSILTFLVTVIYI